VVEKGPKLPPLFQDGLLDNEDYLPSGLLDNYAEEHDIRGDRPGQVFDWERRRGVGPPRRSEFLGAVKAFADGGGLCSPGRWSPESRGSGRYGLCKVRDAAFPFYKAAVVDEMGRKTTPLDFVLRLSAGRFSDTPFDEGLMERARLAVAESLGGGADLLAVASGQCFCLDLIARLLKTAGDPDWAFYEQLREGLPLGVDTVMDRTPLVFEEKVRWKLNEVESPATRSARTTSRWKGTLRRWSDFSRKKRNWGGWWR